jgi:hypothetical protein
LLVLTASPPQQHLPWPSLHPARSPR